MTAGEAQAEVDVVMAGTTGSNGRAHNDIAGIRCLAAGGVMAFHAVLRALRKSDIGKVVPGIAEPINDVFAAYFAEQPFESADQEVDEDLAGMGAQIHEQRCEKCHSDGGSLALDDAGILAGQWKTYLVRTLQNYKNGERWQPEKMQPAIEALGEKDINALAEYYAREGKK